MSVSKFHSRHKILHVRESDLLPPEKVCPVCLSAESRQQTVLQQQNPDVWFLRCLHCKACSASRMPTQDFLKGLYSQFYASEDQEVTFRGVHRFAKHILSICPRPQNISKILDFGGGSGALAIEVAEQLQKINRRAIEICVVDFEKQELSKKGDISLTGVTDLSDIGESYDLVIASAVLEHIPDVNKQMLDLVSKLGPGGFFYGRTPFSIPLKQLFSKYDMLFPFHVHDMGFEFWNAFDGSFSLTLDYIASQPSIVESLLSEDPVRTVIAHSLKLPTRIELSLRNSKTLRRPPVWPYVGGWEVGLVRPEDS